MRVAALDLGSNTSLLMIAEMEGARLRRVLHDETTVTRMGQGVHADRRFHPEALARLDACLGHYRATIDKLSCDRVIAVATSAARDVTNGEALLALGRRHEIPIHIISGEREARLTFLGAVEREDREGLVVIDVGGGSTELIHQHQGQVRGTSVNVGSVRLSELFIRHDPPHADEQAAVREYTDSAFAKAPLPAGPFREVIAVAGTPTTLAAIEQRTEFSEEKINGFKMSRDLVDVWTVRLAAMTLAERAALPGMQPKRADVIVPGTLILAAALRALHQSMLTVSTRGVRYGVAKAWEEFA